MQKFEVIKKLEELKNCKIVRFTMIENLSFDIPMENIINYPDAEMLEAPENQFKCLYCSISDISPSP